MATAQLLPPSALFLSLLFVSCFTQVFAHQNSLVVAQFTSLNLTPSLPVEKSPGFKPGTKVLCERVDISGLSRLKNLAKFAHSVKVNVSHVPSSSRPPNVLLCFHRNVSREVGMCPQGQWGKLSKGSWAKSMSPFDHKVLDICTSGSSPENLKVSIDEDSCLYRIIFLVLGSALMTMAWALSKSLIFYYGSAMAIGVLLVILMILFQGMKLLPTGRKNSLAIFLYAILVGLYILYQLIFMQSFMGSWAWGLCYFVTCLDYCVQYLWIWELVKSAILYLLIFVLLFFVLAGAWLGFWVVHKLVLTEDGSIDISVSTFVAWAIRLFGAAMVLQSSVDPLLSAMNFICGILVSFILRNISPKRFRSYLYKNIFRKGKSKHRRYRNPDTAAAEDSYDEYNNQRPRDSGYPMPQSEPFTPSPRSSKNKTISDSEPFYSTFHNTPERRRYSKEEWEKFTRETTKRSLEGLVSSPDFSRWAVVHANRITLIPEKDSVKQQRRWLPWF